ncbi:hypothetical protein H8356DRAFT_1650351 [Neocallimastix lanati (nom. inval.)]|nr:hypothetical protein H8356DRAFT_1650351 [Neocallimastix sp. JGI-2020a]
MSYQNTDTSSIEILTTENIIEEGNGEQNIRINRYETAVPMRIDIEAACTYVIGGVSGIFFLILETKNDYVRFHAWQSSVLFCVLMVINFIFLKTFLIHLLIPSEVGIMCFLAYQAYINADSLFRYEIPIIGSIASDWVDSE